MPFNRITDPVKIKEVLRAHMLQPEKQRAPFLATIRQKPGEEWNGWKVTPGGHIIEGARPLGASTDCSTGEVVFTLTNSDSNYTQSIGSVKLSGIEYVETLR